MVTTTTHHESCIPTDRFDATFPVTVELPGRRHLGFTLVEILVVIAILAALAALLTPSLRRARISATINTAIQDVQRLTLALEGYASDYGDYPPTDMEEFYGISGNGIHLGIESLVAHLATREKGGPYFEFKEDQLDNQDSDNIQNTEVERELNWIFGDDQLREYRDPWGQPFIYIHNRDYERSFVVLEKEGKKATARAGTSKATATFHSLTTFQIWSMGPNGINDNGRGDDIGSW